MAVEEQGVCAQRLPHCKEWPPGSQFQTNRLAELLREQGNLDRSQTMFTGHRSAHGDDDDDQLIDRRVLNRSGQSEQPLFGLSRFVKCFLVVTFIYTISGWRWIIHHSVSLGTLRAIYAPNRFARSFRTAGWLSSGSSARGGINSLGSLSRINLRVLVLFLNRFLHRPCQIVACVFAGWANAKQS
jgi:hypothetical protein